MIRGLPPLLAGRGKTLMLLASRKDETDLFGGTIVPISRGTRIYRLAKARVNDGKHVMDKPNDIHGSLAGQYYGRPK